eukprot:GDKK01059049.1.p1 GENE.GDKK01059049.1~~GDKK01059049.1.p1  ORF type:complete len:262 (+),score=-1.88 GDKK01059049.1:25-786(+)
MDQGTLRCLGPLEHLKHKFGQGYELTLVVDNIDRVDSVFKFLSRHYPEAILVEARQQRFLFTLPYETTDLALLFQTVQMARDNPATGIIDYTLQQTSLEQVFMRVSELCGSKERAENHRNDGKKSVTSDADEEGEAVEGNGIQAKIFSNSITFSSMTPRFTSTIRGDRTGDRTERQMEATTTRLSESTRGLAGSAYMTSIINKKSKSNNNIAAMMSATPGGSFVDAMGSLRRIATHHRRDTSALSMPSLPTDD